MSFSLYLHSKHSLLEEGMTQPNGKPKTLPTNFAFRDVGGNGFLYWKLSRF